MAEENKTTAEETAEEVKETEAAEDEVTEATPETQAGSEEVEETKEKKLFGKKKKDKNKYQLMAKSSVKHRAISVRQGNNLAILAHKTGINRPASTYACVWKKIQGGGRPP